MPFNSTLVDRLTPLISNYKQHLPEWTRDELYKWRAVHVFQENWDLEAPDFPAMLRRSLAETGNLLSSAQYFAKRMIERFAEQLPEEVRVAFSQLFDESQPLAERLPRFKAAAEDWRERFEGPPANSHYQDERAMLVYLTLRYPDWYYLFKPMMYQDFAELVGAAVDKRQRAKIERVLGYIELANQVRDVLGQDDALVAAHHARLPADVYPDAALHLLTQDFIYCTVRAAKATAQAEQPNGVGPATLDDDDNADEKEQPHEQPLAWAIGAGEGGYLWNDWKDNGEMSIGWDDLGDLRNYNTKEAIRQELLEETTNGSTRKNDALACWQFYQDIRPGDYVVAKRGRTRVLGVGRVVGEYEFQPDRSNFQHIRRVKWLLEGSWERTADAGLPTKTLTEVTHYKTFIKPVLAELETPAQLRRIELIPIKTGGEAKKKPDNLDKPARPAYTFADAAADLFMPEEALAGLLSSLQRKKNLILQGPPGVGKSFVARRLAYLLLGEEDADRVEMVQFHPSYSYEDFIMGYRATEKGGFAREAGVFLKFVRDVALANPDQPHVFIIDELNRANLGKVLGEGMLLLESDKRGPAHKVRLPYGDEFMFLPDNLYVIGTMNTADRSLALVDFALRRRFAFKRLHPELGMRFVNHLRQKHSVDAEVVTQLVAALNRLNTKIEQDRTLGLDFLIGHSYYSEGPQEQETAQQWLARVLEDEIEPQLQEYWIETPAQASAAVRLMRLDGAALVSEADE
jgi:5-methylcytosine-specific restriction protein B